MTPAEAAVEALAQGLWGRLRDVVLAAERLERFNFAPERETAPSTPDWIRGLMTDEAALAGSVLDLVRRAAAVAVDPVNHRVLSLLVERDDPIPLAELARAAGLPALTTVERVSDLQQVGLASRVLDQGAVTATPAGRGWVRLLDLVAARVTREARAGLPGLSGGSGA
jgi:predicted DNA-binding transcriptional regulator